MKTPRQQTRKISTINSIFSDTIESPKKKMRSSPPLQSVETLSAKGISSFKLGDHGNAEACFSQALCRVDIHYLCNTVDSHVVAEAMTQSSARSSSAIAGQSCQSSTPPAEYDEGMRIYSTAQPLHQSYQSDMVACTLFYNIAQTYVNRRQHKESLKWFNHAQERCVASGAQRSLIFVKILSGLGHCSYRLNDEKSAMVYFNHSLALIPGLDLGRKHMAAALNCVGVLVFNQLDHRGDKVMKLFKRSLTHYRESPTSKDTQLQTATVLNNIGRVYYLQADFDKALSVYQEALQIRRQFLESQSIDIAATVYNIGQAHQQLGDHPQALQHYEEFLQIAKTVFGEFSRDVALVYRGIAEIHREKKELKMSQHYFSLALNAQQVCLGQFSSDVATTLNKLGNLCYELKDFPSAMQHYHEGLTIERFLLPAGHPHIIVTLTNIAHIHKQAGDHSKALAAYRQVYEMEGKAHEAGGDDLQSAETLSSIGLMEYHMRDYESSFESYQHALRIRRQRPGSEDQSGIASNLNSIGLVLFKQDQFDLAKKCFIESLRIRSNILGKDHQDVAIMWYNIATIHFETGEDELAIRMYKETLRVERAALGDDHADVVLTLQHLGQVHQQLGHTEKALGFFQEALDIERRRGKSQNRSLSRILNLLGNVYLQLGKTPEMMKCYIEASRIFEATNQGGAEILVIAGYNFYGLSKSNPLSAPVA